MAVPPTREESVGRLSVDLVFNVGSQLFLRLVTAVTALYAARVFGPEQFGVWSLLQIVFMYTAQAHLGTVNAMMREVPLALARNERGRAESITNSTWVFVTASSVLAAAGTGLVVAAMLRGNEHRHTIALGCAWLVAVQLQSVFFQFYCRAYAKFKLLGIVSVANACVMLPITMWSIPRHGLAGYLFGISSGFTVVVVAVLGFAGVQCVVSRRDIQQLIEIGLPMLPGALILYFNISIERFVLAAGIGAVAVGTFAAGSFFFQVGGTFWELIVYTAYSRLSMLYGRTNDVRALSQTIAQTVPAVLWMSSLAQGVLLLVLPALIRTLLPAYSESVLVAQILVVAMNLWGIAQLINAGLTIANKQKQSAVLQAAFLIVKVVACTVVVVLSQRIASIAYACLVAVVVHLATTLTYWKNVSGSVVASPSQIVLLWGVPTLIAAACAYTFGGRPFLSIVAFALFAIPTSLLIHLRSQTFRRLAIVA